MGFSRYNISSVQIIRLWTDLQVHVMLLQTTLAEFSISGCCICTAPCFWDLHVILIIGKIDVKSFSPNSAERINASMCWA